MGNGRDLGGYRVVLSSRWQLTDSEIWPKSADGRGWKGSAEVCRRSLVSHTEVASANEVECALLMNCDSEFGVAGELRSQAVDVGRVRLIPASDLQSLRYLPFLPSFLHHQSKI